MGKIFKLNKIGLLLIISGLLLVVFSAIYFGYALVAEARLSRISLNEPGNTEPEQLNKLLQEKELIPAPAAASPGPSPLATRVVNPDNKPVENKQPDKPATREPAQMPGGKFWYLPDYPAKSIASLTDFPAVTKIVLPMISAYGITAEVVETGWDPEEGELNWVVGHVRETPNPGQPGKIALLGHKSSPVTNQGAIFRELIDIKLGDPIVVYTGNNWYLYLVSDKLLLPKEQVRMGEIFASTDKQLLTLITCEPEYVYSNRLFVTARLHPYWLGKTDITPDSAESVVSEKTER